jgi:hypothetical protein
LIFYLIKQIKKWAKVNDEHYQSSPNLLPPLQGEGWGGVIENNHEPENHTGIHKK